jgi:hypothetical protein
MTSFTFARTASHSARGTIRKVRILVTCSGLFFSSIVISPYYKCSSVAVRCRAGVDVNIVNLQGRSPLRIALLEGNLDLAGLLLDNGANIDYLDNDSR